MISRCPSCAGQVRDEDTRCPSCHWDFIARKKVPPAGGAAPAAPATPPRPLEPAPKPSSPSGIAFVPFSESVGTTQKRPAEKAPEKKPEMPALPETPKLPAAARAEGPASAPDKKSDGPSGAGLLQFPKIDPAKKVEPPFASPPPAAKEPASNLPRERPEDGPKTAPPPERRSQPASGMPQEPAPRILPESAEIPNTVMRPVSDGKAEIRAAERAAEPAGKSVPSKRTRPVAWPGAAAVAILSVAGAVVFTNMRTEPGAPEVRAGSRPRASLFERGAASIKLDVSKLMEDDSRDIRRIQRAVVDPTRPAMPAVIIAEEAPPAPAPTASTAAAQPQAVPAPAVAPAAAAPAAAPSPTPKASAAVPAAAAPAGSTAPATAPSAPVQAGRARNVVVLGQVAPAVMPLNPPKTRIPAETERAGRAMTRAGWTFIGRVYDLVTLQPVAGAKLVFSRADGPAAAEALADDYGQYQIEVPASADGEGYRMKLSHPKYEAYLDETNPPFSATSPEDRIAAAAIRPANKLWKGQGAAFKRDVVAIPKTLPSDE